MRGLCCTQVMMLFAVASARDTDIPKYQHRDKVTSVFHTCDQCPPGTFVKQHCNATSKTLCSPCPEQHYSEHWHWDEQCQYCTAMCKERQNIQQKCNSTHNLVCRCIDGYYLNLEFCVRHKSCPWGYGVKKLGTAESDTLCEMCPDGYFSNEHSATKPCVKHTDCGELKLRLLMPGSAERDAICDRNDKVASSQCLSSQYECHADISLCEEAVFRFIASQGLTAYQLEVLMDNLPGKKVDRKNIERIKQMCNPKQHILYLLKMWMNQNKDQEKIYSIIQDVNECERVISRRVGFQNLTLDHFNAIINSLPGNKVKESDIQRIVKTCDSKQYVLQLLSLWKIQNGDQDTASGLLQTVKKLKSHKVPKRLLQGLKRIIKLFNSSAIYRIYQKMFFEIIQGSKCWNSKVFND
ncbi:tumor necrosis factor receptor superfamily member 11B-like [Polypterus senegalus]|uniref:tumor necrosis factor receptor superfamily member 11B-like n=1 Tax=Polypterus senegalus TaxID=55291 RepID=UPI00196668CA|nr:tumor necrosis factor receptor superfamily member 11B-like [Polypterus senegalus]